LVDQEPDKVSGRRARIAQRRERIQLPWEAKGWYTDQQEASRNPDIDEQLGRRSGVIPGTLGSRNRPGMAINPAMNNPYINIALAMVFVWLALFVFGKLQENLLAAVLTACFFGVISFVIVLVSVIRIPSWHRSRRDAKAWVAEHGGEIPLGLLHCLVTVSSHAASAAGVFMMASNSIGVKRPKRACLRRRW
jgi:hypothetical protein